MPETSLQPDYDPTPDSPEMFKAFRAHGSFTKAVQEPDGRMYLWGPVSTERKDYDGEIVEKAGILEGLKTHDALGGHVDYAHLYRKSVVDGKPDPDLLVGRRQEFREIDGIPCVGAELYANNPLAKKIFRQVNDGCPMGYSVDGVVQFRKGNRIKKTEIHLLSIDPMPKNFDCRLKAGPMPLAKAFDGLMPLCKALSEEDFNDWPDADQEQETQVAEALSKAHIGLSTPTRGSVSHYLEGSHDMAAQHHGALRSRYVGEGQHDRAEFHHGCLTGMHMAKEHIQGGTTPEEMHGRAASFHEGQRAMAGDGASQFLRGVAHGAGKMHQATQRAVAGVNDLAERVGKALTVGSGVVTEGATGGAALRTQDLVGAKKERERDREKVRGKDGLRECVECHARNAKGRKTCHKCGASLSSVSAGQPHGIEQASFGGISKGVEAAVEQAVSKAGLAIGGRRVDCPKCGHSFIHPPAVASGEPMQKAHIGFEALVKKLMDEKGYSRERAEKIAAAIGRRKYGAAGMERRAAAGRMEKALRIRLMRTGGVHGRAA